MKQVNTETRFISNKINQTKALVQQRLQMMGDIYTGALLLTRINFNPSMDMRTHEQSCVGRNYLSILKLQLFHRWSLRMDKLFHPTHYDWCNASINLSFSGLNRQSYVSSLYSLPPLRDWSLMAFLLLATFLYYSITHLEIKGVVPIFNRLLLFGCTWYETKSLLRLSDYIF